MVINRFDPDRAEYPDDELTLLEDYEDEEKDPDYRWYWDVKV